jgi:hypothetical protein
MAAARAFSLRQRQQLVAIAPLPHGTVLGKPMAQRALVDSEITSNLCDRFPGLPDDPHSPPHETLGRTSFVSPT